MRPSTRFLAMRHLHELVGDQPLYIVGYRMQAHASRGGREG